MIKHIRLRNFKCFENEPFEIKPLTLLTGINGMGKSSLIQSLLLLKQSYVSKYLQTQNKVALFNESFVDLENCEELCYKKADPQIVEIELANDANKIYKWSIDASIPDEKEPSFIFEGDNTYSNEAIFSDDFIYLNAERFGPRKRYGVNYSGRIYNTKLGVQGELTPPYILKASTDNREIATSALIHPTVSEDKSLKENEKKLLYINLNAWVSDILGRRVSADIDTLDKDNVKLSFTIKGGKGGKFSAMQVGFGFSFSLPVILAPLAAKPGDLLIIENPEAHLHPTAQAKIGKLLGLAAGNGVQVIIETHSDHVLNGIRLAVKQKLIPNDWVKIYFWGDDEYTTTNKREPDIDVNGRITQWPANFFDTWENSLMDLM